MARRPSAAARVGAALVFFVALPAGSAAAAPAPAPAPAVPASPPAPPGPTFANKDLGLSVEGPSGWKLTPATGGVSAWETLATFVEQPTPARPQIPAGRAAQSTLLARRASAVTLAKLRVEVTKAYADDRSFAVSSIVDLPSNGRRALSGILVDATQTRAAEGPPPPSGQPAPPPVTWRILAAYFLGGEYEYFLFTQVPATLYASVQPQLARMLDGFTIKRAGAAPGPKGEGSFRDESAGFACLVPAGYGVRLPERTLHLVEFAPAGAGTVLGVYRMDSALDLDAEAKALVDYYTGAEVGGEATSSQTEVAGRPAALVTAKGRPPGFAKDSVFFVAIVKRGTDTFRLRASDDVTAEGDARGVFEKFVKGFVLSGKATAPPVKEGEKPADGEEPPK